MANDLVTHAEWIRRTAAVGRIRSEPLKELDTALKRYEQSGDGNARLLVVQKLAAWKQSQGTGDEWKRSVRNRDLIVEELTARLKGGDSDKAWGLVPDFMHEDLIHARLGVLYLFSHLSADADYFSVILEGGLGITNGVLSYGGTSLADGGLGSNAMSQASLALNPVMVAGNELINAGREGFGVPPQFGPYQSKYQEFKARFMLWLEQFVNKLLDNLREKFKSWELPAASVKAAINCACGALLSAATAGLISGAMDTARGVVNTLDAAHVKFRTWRLGRDVDMASGHPATVVDAIRRAMTLSLFQGLWQMLKGAGGMAITGATAAAGLIFSVAVAVAEMLAKVIWRLVEIAHMRGFFKSAAEHWGRRDAPGGLHRQPFAFATWYREYALNCPAIAVLTLNSGICGDKMNYLSLYKESGGTITSDEFRKGAQFIDSLKPWGADYLKSCGYAFTATDGFVDSLLTFAKGHPAERNQVWEKVKTIARA